MSVLEIDQTAIFANPDKIVEPQKVELFCKMVEQLKQNTPLEYIISRSFFMGLDFFVNKNVLIPRYETELLAQQAIEYIKATNAKTVLDMCTGSGCVLVSLLYYTSIIGVGADISKKALNIAKKNAAQNNVSNRARFVLSDMFENITEKFDIIISNPPYIPTEHIRLLQKSVGDHEPHIALDGGVDGLAFYRTIAKKALTHLNSGGVVFLEIGYDQGLAVKDIFVKAGYNVVIKKDYAGFDRIVIGCL